MDASGACWIVAPVDKPGDPPNSIAPGFYRILVTKEGESIPAKYNTETILGQEVSGDNPNLKQGMPTFNLEY